MKISCLAMDDEPLALKQMEEYIAKTSWLSLAGSCRNAFEAMEFLGSNKVDLLFADINMPELSGMDFVKSLNREIPVIFTTAYSEYAVESYQVEAIDYLLKPIAYTDFLRAANKARRMLQPEKTMENDAATDTSFFVKSEGRFVKIIPDEVEYVESLNEYVRFHFTAKKNIMSLMRLKNVEAILPAGQFMRVHRSYIVNTSRITSIERNRILISGDEYIPVGEQYREAFKKFLDGHFLA